jgi:hypothetical protein
MDMDNILDEASSIVQCRQCPWFRSCALPIKVSPEDVRKQWQSAMPGMGTPMNDSNMGQFFASMTQMAQSSVLEGCPIFIQRLRNSPKLAQRIKEMMQNWSEE